MEGVSIRYNLQYRKKVTSGKKNLFLKLFFYVNFVVIFYLNVQYFYMCY